MQILVATNHLFQCGGTENYTYALLEELIRRGHSVEYFTFKKGFVSKKIEKELKVSFMSKGHYDLILANHNTCVSKLYKNGFIIQTCHGIYPKLEQPNMLANVHVGISYEVNNHLKELGVINPKLIYNGINCERFKSVKPTHDKLTTVLSLCQSESANDFISDCCKELGVSFKSVNKLSDKWCWNIEDYINDSDLVVGIGRSAYDAFACGRCAISFDERNYCGKHGDGYITSSNIDESIKFNMSGRATNRTFTKSEFISELLKYNKTDGEFLREFAVQNLNIRKNIDNYLSYNI